jgi:hypothetical protein
MHQRGCGQDYERVGGCQRCAGRPSPCGNTEKPTGGCTLEGRRQIDERAVFAAIAEQRQVLAAAHGKSKAARGRSAEPTWLRMACRRRIESIRWRTRAAIRSPRYRCRQKVSPAVWSSGDARWRIRTPAARCTLACLAGRGSAHRAHPRGALDPASCGCRLLGYLQEAFDQPQRERMENILLVGESGMGKTMLIRKFERRNAVAFDQSTGVQHRAGGCGADATAADRGRILRPRAGGARRAFGRTLGARPAAAQFGDPVAA